MNRDLFTLLIEAIKNQSELDKEISNGLTQLYGTTVPIYNNSFLIEGLKSVILFHFNNQKEVLSEIDHYCFFCNFGRIEKGDEVLIETPGELYDRLVSEFIVH